MALLEMSSRLPIGVAIKKSIYGEKVALRFELRVGALQAPALPLGYATKRAGIMGVLMFLCQFVGGSVSLEIAKKDRQLTESQYYLISGAFCNA